ncbi:hypothetical protein L2725_14240 [Shewanella corallii]|uniref:Lipoprotein n=1 Tax=Shewanella corallii TaxID=560080 RepID=A0ABT0N924_9GAMM|nr:hypothetical protein [Shewanella corallii]
MRNNTFTLLFLMVLLMGSILGCEQAKVQVSPRGEVDKTLCDFGAGYCNAESGEININLILMPDFAPSERPIDVKITTNVPVSDVTMKLEGRDMFMGVIPVNIQPADDGSFSGQMIFGSCSSGYMVWRATVGFVHQGEQKYVWFDFLADADG